MFSMFKSATNQTNISPHESNPITQFFEVGKLTACAGPELVWKIHDAFRKSDGKVVKILDMLYVHTHTGREKGVKAR